MEYLVRMAQIHETFRVPELQALATIEGIELEIVEYSDNSPFCVIRLPSAAAASRLITRSILCHAIYELWGLAPSYPSLHTDVAARSSHLWPLYHTSSFSFDMDTYMGKRSASERRALITSFNYLDFAGPIDLRNPEHRFMILEEWPFLKAPAPSRVAFGRLLGTGARTVVQRYDLKKRVYISTTSMDSELALVTANMALADRGKVMYDPFTGTGSFPLACAHFGAHVLGSDIDGRSIRGTGKEKGKGNAKRNVVENFVQYGSLDRYLDGFVSDLTNSPLRGCVEGGARGRWLDGVVCDPPYGVREGLKVLGSVKEELKHEVLLPNGLLAHLQSDYIPPKRAYSFEAMLDDILDFAYRMLVDDARLCMWMPTANDQDTEIAIPTHPGLELLSVSVQQFSKWARRLLTYRRLRDEEIDSAALQSRTKRLEPDGTTASELNAFRRKYFEGFKEQRAVEDRDRERDVRRGFWVSPGIWIR